MAEQICVRCGTVGKPGSTIKGGFGTELLLWVIFLLVGFYYSLLLLFIPLFYSIWRLTTRGTACGTCGSSEMVPLTSPAGQELQKRFSAGGPPPSGS